MKYLKLFDSFNHLYLDPEQVKIGMTAEFEPGATFIEHVEILKIGILQEMSEKEFRHWQSLSESGWMTNHMEVHHKTNHVEYELKFDTFKNKADFMKNNALAIFEPNGIDYLMHFKTKINIVGESQSMNSVNRFYNEVCFYNPNTNWYPFFAVNIKELIKQSNKLNAVNKNTGIFEKYEDVDITEWLEPVEVRPGMIGIDERGHEYQIFEILNIGQLRKKPQFFREYLKYNSDWMDFHIEECVRGELLSDDTYICRVDKPQSSKNGMERPKWNILVYSDQDDVNEFNIIRVPIDEEWKDAARDKLKDTSAKTGLLEKVIIETRNPFANKSWFNEDGIVDAQDVRPGMIGYDCYNGRNVKITGCYKIEDLMNDPRLWQKVQNSSMSQWCKYQFDIASNPSGTLDWEEADETKPFKDFDDFLINNVLTQSHNIIFSKKDYLMVVETELDIQGNPNIESRTGNNLTFEEVFPYHIDWLEVPIKELWKKSKSLKSNNDVTGIMENYDDWYYKDVYVKPRF